MKCKSHLCWILSLSLLLLAGCVRETTDGSARVFAYELWVSASVLFGGLVAAPLGWFLRTVSERFGWALLILGPIAALFFAPSLFLERAVLDDNSNSVRSGIWGMTAVHQVRFQDLRQIRLVAEQVRGRRRRMRIQHYLMCERNDGTSEKIPVSNDVSKVGASEFLAKASERGVTVVQE